MRQMLLRFGIANLSARHDITCNSPSPLRKLALPFRTRSNTQLPSPSTLPGAPADPPARPTFSGLGDLGNSLPLRVPPIVLNVWFDARPALHGERRGPSYLIQQLPPGLALHQGRRQELSASLADEALLLSGAQGLSPSPIPSVPGVTCA